MKTDQKMVTYINIGRLQRTQDGYFNANTLLNNYLTLNPLQANTKKLGHYKNTQAYKDFIIQLQKEGIKDPVKSSNKGTWMHGKVFVDFAMWLSVEFKSMALGWIMDGLIQSRVDAGDYHNQMCAQIMSTHISVLGKKPKATVFMEEARYLKEVLGLAGKDRNSMTEKELANLTILQKVNAELISKRIGKNSREKQLVQLAQALNR